MLVLKSVFWVVLVTLGMGGCATVNAGAHGKGVQMVQLQSYVVTLKPDVQDVPAQARRLSEAASGKLGHIYQSSLRGFSVQMTPEAAQIMRRDPVVSDIEVDSPVRTQ
jgi:hypothetical protein